MIVKCKNCGVSYNFEENLLTKEGAWLRCTNCHFVFFLPAAYQEEESTSEQNVPLVTEPISEQSPLSGSPAEISEKKAVKRFVFRFLAWFSAFVLFIALLFSAFVFFPKQIAKVDRKIRTKISSIISQYRAKSMEPTVAPQPKTTIEHPVLLPTSELRKIGVIINKPTLMENTKMGNIVVQSGRIINRSEKALKNVVVEGRLISPNGKLIKRTFAVCGNTLTPEMIREDTCESVTTSLLDKNKGVSVMDSKELPFLLVFCDLTDIRKETAAHFNSDVMVVEAQILAK